MFPKYKTHIIFIDHRVIEESRVQCSALGFHMQGTVENDNIIKIISGLLFLVGLFLFYFFFIFNSEGIVASPEETIFFTFMYFTFHVFKDVCNLHEETG